MEKIFADISQKWEPLSTDHEKMASYFEDVLDTFLRGDDIHPSYLITGVFGQGKTTFLYHILRESIDKGILPIFVIARDIFEKIDAKDYGDVKEGINKIVEKLKADFQRGDFSQYRQYIMSLPKRSQEELIGFYQRNLDKISHSDKVILLVDELEDIYKKIKEKAGSDPLRTWLEDKSYLKILSLTPSGIYDLGGADESRFIKWNVPPVSIEYIREKIGLPAGKANALWWLSRGVPRHIIQNLGKLKNISEEDDSYKIRETLESLERIGKEPARVNAVEVGPDFDDSKYKFIINLIPQKSQPYRGFLITKELNEGKLSELLKKMFNLVHESEKGLSLTIAHYFKLVAMVLSDEDFTAYVDANEINEFMELVLDILLENEYKKPVVEKNMARLLEVSEKLRSDPNLLLTALITNPPPGIFFENEVNKKLPFTINEIRKLFPPSVANPIIKSEPDVVLRDVESKGKPVCKSDDFMFFASYRDFEKYLSTDEFKNAILPEGKSFVILLPEEDFGSYEDAINNPTSKSEQILKWLLNNGKLKVVKSSPSIKIFLLSLYGYEYRTPYNIDNIAEKVRSSQEILLKKKFEVYYTALNELIKDNKPTPKYFFKEKPEPKGLRDVWGATQLKEETAAIAGLALSFYELPPNDRANLVSLRELFRTKGKRGDLADIKVGKGLPTLADDLLPRKDIKGIVDAPSVEDLESFWSKDDREELDILSRLLDLQEFKKLSEDLNHKRILEAFWRATRDEFDINGINELKRRLEEVIKKLEFIQKVEKKCSSELKLGLIFGEREVIIKSLDGLKKLVGLSFESKLPKFILKLYLEAILKKIEASASKLYIDVQRIDEGIGNLNKRVSEIVQYLSDKKEVLDFISDRASFEDIEQELNNLLIIDADLDLSRAEREIYDRLRSTEAIFTNFGKLENKLNELKQKLTQYNLLEVR